MRFGMMGFTVIFGLFLAALWFGGRRSRRKKAAQDPANTETVTA